MPINSALLQVGGAAMAAAAAYVGLASAVPDATGTTNATTHGRLPSGLTSAAGVVSGSAKAFTGGAAGGPVAALTYWSAQTGGTYYGYQLITGDQTSNAAGAYTVDTVTLNGTAS